MKFVDLFKPHISELSTFLNINQLILALHKTSRQNFHKKKLSSIFRRPKMATISNSVEKVLCAAIPDVPDEIKQYVCETIAQAPHPKLRNPSTTTPQPINDSANRRLDSTVHIGDSLGASGAGAGAGAVQNGTADAWLASARNDSQVDLKKLGKAEAKSREKMEKRTTGTGSGGVEVRKKQDVTATASCASRKTVADETNAALVDIKFEQVDLSFGERSEEVSSTLSSRLTQIYAELSAKEADKAPALVAGILFGLGFSQDDQQRPTREFSGGWRMRLALAQALFLKPDLLLLDEPTNMLDMKAIYWLENHLQNWPNTIMCVSHDRNFLNTICTDMLHMHSGRLDAYKGDYDNFEKAKDERLSQQQREYEAQMELRKHTQAFIDKFRFNAKRASLVQSRIKMLERLPVLKAVERDSAVILRFPNDIEKLSGAVLQLDSVNYSYTPTTRPIFTQTDCNVDSDSRVCIVGDNGAGKSTLLKLLMGNLEPSQGFRNAHRRLKIGYFAQHHVDQLDMQTSPLELIAKRFPGQTVEHYRSCLGRFGVSSDLATRAVSTLSGGQKSRLAFTLLAMQMPNMLIMDEPTNHLDIDTVEALGKALNEFPGGVVLVSHDERLIELVCKELWLVKDKTVSRIEGGLAEYKKLILKQLAAAV